MQYLIVIEKTATGYSAYSPDVDGWIATGATKQELEQNMREAIEFHVEGLHQEAAVFLNLHPIPPTSTTDGKTLVSRLCATT
jgi:predicted RNase H-like HicB family nuclease